MSKQLTVQQQNNPSVIGSQDWVQVVREQWPTLTDSEILLVSEVCKKHQLEPVLKHIHPVKRYNKQAGKEVLVLQMGIDGLRLLARRSGEYAGQRSYWCGDDGQWRDVWLSKTPPAAAKVEVFTKGSSVPTVAVATWNEYVQTGKTGTPMGLWSKMPANQLAKCFDGDTEVLTDRGFYPFRSVPPRANVMQVFEGVLERTDSRPWSQPWDGDMLTYDSDDINFCVTPNHDMETTLGRVEARVIEATANSKGLWRIPRTIWDDGLDADYTDDELYLAAAIAADGWRGDHGWNISVSRKHKIDALDAIDMHRSLGAVRAAGSVAEMPHGRIIRTNFDKVMFRYGDDTISDLLYADKSWSVDALHRLNSRQARIIVDALIFFDGSTNKKPGVRRYYTSRLDHLGAFEYLCVKAGYSVSQRYSRTGDDGCNESFYVTISDRTDLPIFKRKGRPSIERVQNTSGLVHCVTVPSGTIVVRRNGFSMVCGNCAEAQALRKALPGELAGLYSHEEMGQADGGWRVDEGDRRVFMEAALAAGFTEAQAENRLRRVESAKEFEDVLSRFEQAKVERSLRVIDAEVVE